MPRKDSHVLYSWNYVRISSRVADRNCAYKRCKEIDIVVRELGNVRGQPKTDLHRHIEQATVSVNGSLPLAKRIPCESNAGSKVVSGGVIHLCSGGCECLRRKVEVPHAALPFAPHSVVVVAQPKIKGKVPRHSPVVLNVKIPVGIPDTEEAWIADLLQDKRTIYASRQAKECTGVSCCPL